MVVRVVMNLLYNCGDPGSPKVYDSGAYTLFNHKNI